MERIGEVLQRVMDEVDRGNGHRNGKLVIDTLDEAPESLLGLLNQAIEAGVIPSRGDISSIRLNGRAVLMSQIE